MRDNDLFAHLSHLRDAAEVTRYEITSRGGGFGPRGEHRILSLQDVIERIDDLVHSISRAQLAPEGT